MSETFQQDVNVSAVRRWIGNVAVMAVVVYLVIGSAIVSGPYARSRLIPPILATPANQWAGGSVKTMAVALDLFGHDSEVRGDSAIVVFQEGGLGQTKRFFQVPHNATGLPYWFALLLLGGAVVAGCVSGMGWIRRRVRTTRDSHQL